MSPQRRPMEQASDRAPPGWRSGSATAEGPARRSLPMSNVDLAGTLSSRDSTSAPAVLKVAAVSRDDFNDPSVYNGRLFPLVQGLRPHCDSFEWLGHLSRRKHLPVLALKAFWYRHLLKKSYNVNRDRRLILDYGRQISRKLRGRDFNMVFSTSYNGSQPVAYLDCRQPIVIWTDATFAGCLDFYPELARDVICDEMLRDGLANERAALSRSSLLIYKSDWAAQSAIEHHHVDPTKIRVVPGGPGIESDLTYAEAEAIVRSRPADRCRLLFVGRDWQRKGGDVACRVAEELNRQGLRTELTVVGCRPGGSKPPFVKFTGFLRKSDRTELERLKSLFRYAHFLILPTRAEAMGVIFCEASAFALPSLATNVGGVTAVVKEDRNGKLFSPEDDAPAYCSYVTSLFEDYRRYRDLALSAFNEYRTRLNWDTAGATVAGHMRELL